MVFRNSIMKFDIYHSHKLNYVAEKLTADSYKKVASIEASSLDDAYGKSQNIDSSWLKNPNVISSLDKCRSTCVGDIIYNIEEKQGYMVMNMGFHKVDVLK
jgi:hypothetical protein